MTHLMKVFLYELSRSFRRRGYLFTTFGIPLIGLALLFGYLLISAANNPGEDPQGIPGMNLGVNTPQDVLGDLTPDLSARHGIVDGSGLVSDTLATSYNMQRFDSEADAQAALEAGTISGYYLIAPDYIETGDIVFAMPSLQISVVNFAPVRQMMRQALSQRAAQEGADPAIVTRIQQPATYRETVLTLTTTADGETSSFDTRFLVVYLFTLTLMMSLFVTNGYLLQSVIEEKETRLIEILISSMRPFHLLGGKIFAYGLLGLIQIVVWVGAVILAIRVAGGEQLGATLAVLANVSIPTGVLPILGVYFLLAYLLFAGFYGMVGALSNSMKEGPQYAVIFTLPAAAPLYFIPLFIQSPDGTLPVIMSLFPLTAPIAMTQRMVISQVPTIEIIASIILLALAVIGVMWLAGRVFRVQTLLAGQTPRLRDLPKLVRG